jgi:lysyl-tRNA synthetase class 2
MVDREQQASWQPAADLPVLQARAELLARIRTFFAERGVLEVETPVLSGAGNSDPGLVQWRTRKPETWLRTSPEYAMKRLLAAGSGDIYELGRVFRGDESGRYHNREFTLLEWYRVGWDYHELMDEVADLVRACLPGHKLLEQRLTYRELFQQWADVDPFDDPTVRLADQLAARDIRVPEPDRAECLDLLLSLVIQPQLPEEQLTFLLDFPADQAALARVRRDTPPVAERFETFLGPVELANGYQELTDASEQAQRFERENRKRDTVGRRAVPLDQRLLDALAAGLPECAGVALGVDRLLMISEGATSLAEVLSFSAERA